MVHVYIIEQMEISQAGTESSCLANLILHIQPWHPIALPYLPLWWERRRTSSNRAVIICRNLTHQLTELPHKVPSNRSSESLGNLPKGSEKVGGKIAPDFRSAGSKAPILFLMLYGLANPTGLPATLLLQCLPPLEVIFLHPLKLRPPCFRYSGQIYLIYLTTLSIHVFILSFSHTHHSYFLHPALFPHSIYYNVIHIHVHIYINNSSVHTYDIPNIYWWPIC